MTAAHKRRAAAREAARGFGRDGSRALIIGLCFVSLVALGTLIGGGSSWVPARLGLAQQTLSDEDLTTGSILLVPPSGDQCRLRLIDNATWQIRGDGTVDCDAFLANTKARSKSRPSANVGAIRDSFRNR